MQQLDQNVDGTSGYRLNILGQESINKSLYVDNILPLSTTAVNIPSLVVTTIDAPTIHTDVIDPFSGTAISIDSNELHIDSGSGIVRVANALSTDFVIPTSGNIIDIGAELQTDSAAHTVKILASDDVISDIPIHSQPHTTHFSQGLSTSGQYICVHHTPGTDPQGFCMGSDPDPLTGNFSYLVNDNPSNSVIMGASILGVPTFIFQADKTSGLMVFPGNIESSTINEVNPLLGVTLNHQLLADNSNNRVDITNTLRSNVLTYRSGSSITLITDPVSETANLHGELNVTTFQRGIESTGRFISVHNGGSATGFACGPDPDESTGNYCYLADGNDGNLYLSAKILGFEKLFIVGDKASGSMTFQYPLNLSNSLLGLPSGVSNNNVIQIEEQDDAGYGSPAGGAVLLYADIDSELKVKDSSGNINQISGTPPFGSFYVNNNAVGLVISNPATFTRCAIPCTASFASGFTASGAATGFTYTGAPRYLCISASFSIQPFDTQSSVLIAAGKNPTYNGSNEITSGIINGSVAKASTFVTANTNMTCLSCNFMIDAATNDVFEFVVAALNTASLIPVYISINVLTITQGAD